jgi:hypothetical protein
MSSATRRPAAAARRGRLWRRGLGLSAGLLAAGLVGLGCAAACRPSWYAPASVDYTRLAADKQALVALLDGIGDALNGSRPIEIEIDQARANRWIAARREIEMDLSGLPLDSLERPYVHFLPGNRVRLASLVGRESWRAVVTIEVRLTLEGDEVLMECTALRVGALPVPRSWIWSAFAAAVERAAGPVRVQPGGVRIPNRGVWQNGKRPFRIDRLTIEAGRAIFTLSPR